MKAVDGLAAVIDYADEPRGRGCHVGRLRPTPCGASCARLKLGNFLRRHQADQRFGSLKSLREKLIKIGVKLVSHGRYVGFQMAEVAVTGRLFAEILRLIAEMRPPPDLAPA